MGEKQLGRRAPLLYDLSVDPGESYNVISTYPDVARKMHGLLVEWEGQIKKNPWGFRV
ncbi:MAG: hypothetical protein ACYDAA_19030 [Syntrophales bacterium]